jgi:hypothetical protein
MTEGEQWQDSRASGRRVDSRQTAGRQQVDSGRQRSSSRTAAQWQISGRKNERGRGRQFSGVVSGTSGIGWSLGSEDGREDTVSDAEGCKGIPVSRSRELAIRGGATRWVEGRVDQG